VSVLYSDSVLSQGFARFVTGEAVQYSTKCVQSQRSVLSQRSDPAPFYLKFVICHLKYKGMVLCFQSLLTVWSLVIVVCLKKLGFGACLEFGAWNLGFNLLLPTYSLIMVILYFPLLTYYGYYAILHFLLAFFSKIYIISYAEATFS
ncbi:MAG: hypothetical protein ABIL22_05965, partial [candidate division WOR-3 bacterium]